MLHPTKGHPRRARATISAVVFILALVASQLVFPSPASALTVDLVCTGTATLTFNPGYTFTPQTIATTGSASVNCTGDPNITSGGYTTSGQVTYSCNLSLPSASGQATITWNTAETSTMAVTSLVSINGLGVITVTITGEVIAGKFLGDDYTSISTLIPSSGSCLSPGGVTQTSGPFVAEFSH